MNDILWMSTNARLGRVRDVVQRVSAAHVGGQAIVFKIQLFGLWIEDHVLDHRSELVGGGVDLRLSFRAQAESSWRNSRLQS